MTEMEERPIFTQVIQTASDPSDRTISLAIADADRKGIQIDIALSLVGQLTAALSAEAMRLNGSLPEEDRMQASTINAQAAWVSQDLDGNPVLVFELSNGSLLPLAMKSGDFAGLAAEMALLAAPKGSTN